MSERDGGDDTSTMWKRRARRSRPARCSQKTRAPRGCKNKPKDQPQPPDVYSALQERIAFLRNSPRNLQSLQKRACSFQAVPQALPDSCVKIFRSRWRQRERGGGSQKRQERDRQHRLRMRSLSTCIEHGRRDDRNGKSSTRRFSHQRDAPM